LLVADKQNFPVFFPVIREIRAKTGFDIAASSANLTGLSGRFPCDGKWRRDIRGIVDPAIMKAGSS
jgi:hypothetical protein